jgi:hypothetical protein
MALRVVTVKSSGGDYSSLNAALVGESGDLVSLDRQLRIDCYSFADTTAADSGFGWTTDATRFVTVAAVNNHFGLYGGPAGTTSYRMEPASGAALISRFHNAVLRGLSANNAALDYCYRSRGDAITIDRCIGTCPGATAFFLEIGASGILTNCLGYLSENGFQWNGTTGTFYCYNCTSYGNNDDGFSTFVTGVVLKNCLSASNVVNGFEELGNPFDASSATNASSDSVATAPSLASSTRINQVFTFVDATAHNYHLAATDAGAKGFGTDLSGDTHAPLTVDIDNATVSGTWNIGADQPSTPSVTVLGTATGSITEADVVAGGKTILLVLTSETWIA